MFKPQWHVFRALAWFLLAIAITSAQNLQASTVSGVQQTSQNAPASTCPSHSINYVTQSLPQQCLTTSWTSKPTAQGDAASSQIQTSKDDYNATATQIAIEVVNTTTESATSQDSTSVSSILTDIPTPTGLSQGPSFTQAAAEAPESADTPSGATQVAQDAESESPLDTANFLSFEEWKKQNLAKAGQSAENLRTRTGDRELMRRPNGINNALDSLGEDTEIEIDFRGFVDPANSIPESPSAESRQHQGISLDLGEKEESLKRDPQGVRQKGKDAGKTCKERSNYASFDCAATVMKTNPEAKGSTAVLVENKDSYMLNKCSAKNKFLIVELCDDILIDTVVLANFEFFSSMFRTFRISVSDRYPVKLEKWRDLGTFEARNSRDIQAFLIESPFIWARYLRVEFLTHFGNEYYCPVSLLRVHGTTMMEEFNQDLKRAGTAEESDNDVGDNVDEDSQEAKPEVIVADALKTQAQATPTQDEITKSAITDRVPASTVTLNADASDVPSRLASISQSISSSRKTQDLMFSISDDNEICRPSDKPADPQHVHSQSSQIIQISSSIKPKLVESDTRNVPTPTDNTTIPHSTVPTATSSPVLSTTSGQASSTNQSEPIKTSNQTAASTIKVQTSSTHPSNPNPTTQESFFKSVHKRLQLLESNSTLSLQYIEDQSRILRDAFSKVEKRQLAKTTGFLESLNTTVLTELRDFRMQYDQIWQSTVLELSSQREKSQHEVHALSARLSLLADEIVFQKRMAILQFILILICLGLAIFARPGSSSPYLELPPLMQNAINKSSMSLSRPHFNTSPASPSSTRPSSRYGLLRGWTHRSNPSYDSQQSNENEPLQSPDIEYSPPTPTSQDSPDDRNNDTEDSGDSPPRPALRQTKSSPPLPNGEGRTQADMIVVSS